MSVWRWRTLEAKKILRKLVAADEAVWNRERVRTARTLDLTGSEFSREYLTQIDAKLAELRRTREWLDATGIRHRKPGS